MRTIGTPHPWTMIHRILFSFPIDDLAKCIIYEEISQNSNSSNVLRGCGLDSLKNLPKFFHNQQTNGKYILKPYGPSKLTQNLMCTVPSSITNKSWQGISSIYMPKKNCSSKFTTYTGMLWEGTSVGAGSPWPINMGINRGSLSHAKKGVFNSSSAPGPTPSPVTISGPSY